MQMGIEIQEISIGLYRNAGAGYGILIRHAGLEIPFDDVPGAYRQLSQELPVKEKIDPQPFGDAEHPLPVVHILEYI